LKKTHKHTHKTQDKAKLW